MGYDINTRAKHYYKNFLACGLCYANCFCDDKLQCTVCNKYCHRSCLNISKVRFKNLTEYGVDKAICSNKCCAPILPFYTISDKIFLDTNVGKRKIPCKNCHRECFKVANCLKCSICAKSYHKECIRPRIRTNPILSDNFLCSKPCELKLLPFYWVENYELIDEMTFDAPSKNVDKSKSTPSLSVPPNQFLTPNKNSNEKTGDALNDCVDSFSHVYCEYADQNDVPNVMCTSNPNTLSIFHGNVDGLKSKLGDINEVFSESETYPDIIAVSETGLKDPKVAGFGEYIESEHVALNGYNFERTDTPTNKGGVGVYVTDQLDYDIKDDLRLNVDNCEDLWLEIFADRKKKDKNPLILGVIYRHPNTPLKAFRHYLSRNIELLNKKK